jgi:hypothetical protein
MPAFSRRQFLATTLAVGAMRAVPPLVTATRQRRVLTLVYDKAIGAMRAIDRVVP